MNNTEEDVQASFIYTWHLFINREFEDAWLFFWDIINDQKTELGDAELPASHTLISEVVLSLRDCGYSYYHFSVDYNWTGQKISQIFSI